MRWEFLLVGVLVIGALSLGARQPDPQAALEARTARLQAHIENVESVRAVKRLQYAYGHYVELGLWNDFADLFADDATTNYQQGARGKEEVRKLFLQQVGQGKLGLAEGRIYPHILFQPVVHLSPGGRTAKGRWRILAMLGGLGGSATWYSGVYENEYVFDNGAWKIGVLHSEPRVTAAYTAAGWRDSGVTVPPHYDAASIAKPIPDVAGNARTGGTTMSFAALAARVNGLAQRAALLNDQGEVTNLQDAYGYAIDRKLWDQAASLFSVDGTLELGQQGVYVGQASIRRGLNRQGPQGLRDGERNDHVYLQTLVSVAAGRAHGEGARRRADLLSSPWRRERRTERGHVREHLREARRRVEDSVGALLPAHDRRCRHRLGQERETRAGPQHGVSPGPSRRPPPMRSIPSSRSRRSISTTP